MTTRLCSAALLLWVVALGLVISVPVWRESQTLGEDLTRDTVRLALGYYLVAVSLLLLNRPNSGSRARRLARCCWTLAGVAFLVHLGMAEQYYDHWSHAQAIRRTQEATGFGEGIFVSHLFTLLWWADILWWWWRPQSYAGRSAWLTLGLHGFMAFVIFCGTVVYETGWIRWAGVVMFVWLGGLVVWRLLGTRTPHPYTPPQGEREEI